MTPTDKPCLPGCREDSHLRYGEGGVEYLSGPIRVVTGMIHAPNCPNAPNAPKEPAAPATCQHGRGAICETCAPGLASALERINKPAPTPEPPRAACARCGMRIEPGILHSPDGCYSVPKPEAESVDTGCGECTICVRCAIAQRKQMQALRAELAAEKAAREKAEAERDELALLTVPSDADAQVAVRLRIAEARVAELEAERAEQDASDAFDRLLRDGYDPPEARAILAARSAKGGAK